jgi:hypothetical protein
LVFAKYVREAFRPAAMVVVIVGNDFAENYLDDRASPMLTYFKEDESGDLELVTVPYNVNPLKRVLRNSALMRYLYLNLGLNRVVANGLKYRDNIERHVFIANTLEHFVIIQNREGFPRITISDSRCGLEKEASPDGEISFD